MAGVDKFAHGYHYGDYSGVVWYGPPTEGFWLDRLAVSDRYIGPLFCGVLDQCWQEFGGTQVPRLASEWNTLEGWAAASGRVHVQNVDAAEFAEALARLGPADVVEHCTGCTVEESLECAEIVREFIGNHLSRGFDLFIEDD